MAKEKKKVAKKKVAKKTAKKKEVKKEVNEQGVPLVIRERAAHLARKKAAMDKELKAKDKVFPAGSLKRVQEDSRSKARQTKANEHDKFTWIDVLSGELIKALERIGSLERKLTSIEGKK